MRAFLILAVFAVAGCASTPQKAPVASSGSTRPSADRGSQVAAYAQTMIGKPYRYGGSTPKGFDCSGLVLYSYKQAGVALPRSTDKLRAGSRLVRAAELRPGDLLFFNQQGKMYGHVAIYVGDGKFIHAPSSGRSVRGDRLDNPYWKKHLSEARRPV